VPVAPAASSAADEPKLDKTPSREPQWELVRISYDLERLVGRWVDEENGDAIPDGPTGGTVVKGGVRLDIVHKRKGSKTPFNLTFWAPREGHLKSDTISGGCGFYPRKGGELQLDIDTYCRGYGLPETKAHRVGMVIEANGRGLIKVRIGEILDETLKRPSGTIEMWPIGHQRRVQGFCTGRCGKQKDCIAGCSKSYNECGIKHRSVPPSSGFTACIESIEER
jgi:hypothetical protein